MIFSKFNDLRREKISVSVGLINGAGTTNVLTHYSFRDKDVVNDKSYYYRLKQHDFNGQFEYSNNILVQPSGIYEPFSIKISPNPIRFGDDITLSFSRKPSGLFNTFIYKVNGTALYSKYREEISSSSHKINAMLDPGVYMIVVESENVIYPSKLVIP